MVITRQITLACSKDVPELGVASKPSCQHEHLTQKICSRLSEAANAASAHSRELCIFKNREGPAAMRSKTHMETNTLWPVDAPPSGGISLHNQTTCHIHKATHTEGRDVQQRQRCANSSQRLPRMHNDLSDSHEASHPSQCGCSHPRHAQRNGSSTS